jgi:hypothetical protein
MTFQYYRTTTKKAGRIELISTVESLHLSHFLLHTSDFSTGHTGRIVYYKKPIKYADAHFGLRGAREPERANVIDTSRLVPIR